MGLLFVMRTDAKISIVKEMMISMNQVLIPDKALLGSGYITEYIDKKDSTKKHFVSEQANKFHIKLKNSFPSNLIVIGVHAKKTNYWYDNFKLFVSNVCSRKKPINVTAYYEKDGRWHAKIYFLIKNEIPIAAIIGSSNMTQPAFWDCPSYFNIEADMVIWNKTYDLEMDKIISTFPKTSIISATMNPLWEGDCEEQRLKELYEFINSKLPVGEISTVGAVEMNEFTL